MASKILPFLQRAQASTGLTDIDAPWLLEHGEQFLEALDREARITEGGRIGAEHMIVRAFENRLRHVDLLRRHPEILDEKVEVAAVVVGLPRTGSTLLHRMLAAADGITGMKWYETLNYAPFPGEERGDSSQRREWAKAYLDQMLAAIPDLMAIHPMSLDQVDEEINSFGLLFSSTMIEGTFFVPGFADWLTRHGRTRCYPELRTILQSLQWQDPSRRGKRWVLKTPGHLLALDAVAETFPDATIVMTHRDPILTVPSFASLTYRFYRMVSDVDARDVGKFWKDRLADLLDRSMATRASIGEDRFCDVGYEQLLSDPLAEGGRVLEQAGMAFSPEAKANMAHWLEENRREDRMPHQYSPESFGLDADTLSAAFADYRARFIPGKK